MKQIRIATAAVVTTAASLALVGCAGQIAGSPAPTSAPVVISTFAPADLAAVCVDATKSAFAPDVSFDTASTRVERREVDPEWLVLVPATTAGFKGEAQCTIGGSVDAPVVEMSTASIEKLPEEQIQRLIKGENEGGTK